MNIQTHETQYSFLDKHWHTQPKYVVGDDFFTHCEIHGDWCANASYEEDEISQMIAEQGFVDCPMCLQEVVGVGQ